MSESVKKVAVLEKAFQILEFMVDYPYGVALHKISQGVNLNKSTVYRILVTLKDKGYITQNGLTNEYKLNYKFLIFSSVFSDVDIKRIALPYMQQITEATSFSSSLTLLNNHVSLIIERTLTPRSNVVKVEPLIGFRAPLHCCASGKTLLAGFSDQELEDFFRVTELKAFTSKTITNPLALRKELESIRSLGYAVEDMENEDNIVTLAAPIKNASCQVFAAITVTSIKQFILSENIPELAEMLVKSAAAISAELGCPDYGKLCFR